MSRARRAYERALDGPSRLRPGPRQQPGPAPHGNDAPARRYAYERLVTVDLRHTYFNGSEDRCPALRCQPTPDTRVRMRDWGLLFLDEGTDFSVLFDSNRLDAFLSAVERRSQQGQWTWLSFVLVPDTPYFVNFTDLPSDFQPNLYNLYFNNLGAHFVGSPPSPTDQPLHCEGTVAPPILLNPGEHVTADSRQRVVGTQVQVVLVSDAVDRVVVLDVSGEQVLCKPCSIPRSLLAQRTPYLITCAQVAQARAKGPGEEQRVGTALYLDLVAVPEGLYTLRQLAADGQVLDQEVVLYTQAYPAPLGFIDLVLAKPSPQDTGLYPLCDVPPQGEGARVVPLELQLRFERRSTRWCYFVVPPKGVTYEQLRLVDTDTSQPVTFSGPVPVPVPGAGVTQCFIADQDLPLQELSSFVFELKGLRTQGLFENTLMSRVPVATPALVLPRSGPAPGRPRSTRPTRRSRDSRAAPEATRDYSDIFLNL
ncbi:hypothetical protein [Myxococcus sp. AB025B]|uniref:hypothetical protein n=1 Tax=Myxococcus sp. AB025B TaxID=2562794 RepID=UPI001144EA86|nr:hypothetical protein [Myxococcus sp. AB025B]